MSNLERSCAKCKRKIHQSKVPLNWSNKLWHQDCFACEKCDKPLNLDTVRTKDAQTLYCPTCYSEHWPNDYQIVINENQSLSKQNKRVPTATTAVTYENGYEDPISMNTESATGSNLLLDAATYQSSRKDLDIYRAPETWSVKEVVEWLRCIKLGELIASFECNGIDGAILMSDGFDDAMTRALVPNEKYWKIFKHELLQLKSRQPQQSQILERATDRFYPRERAQSYKAAVPFLVIEGTKVSITHKQLLEESKSLVGFIGPPGAGKSSLCNTVVHCQHRISPTIFFEPSESDDTFTKGLWILSPAAKRLFPSDSDWEVLDMEGFQYKSESCWKMAMVLSVLAEVVVFCSRDPRNNVLYECADVFAKGIEFCQKLSMSPVTQQVFIQVQNHTRQTPDKLATVIGKVQGILQNSKIKVIPFYIPEIKDIPMRELPFYPPIVEAVGALLKQFHFDKNSQAAAAKVKQLESLLHAFNNRDFSKCDKLGLKFLEMDCERIYKQAIAEHRRNHGILASDLTLTSLNTTFEKFIGSPNWRLNLSFEASPFYVEKYQSKLQEWYPSDKRSVAMPEIYRPFYDSKMATLKAKLETEELERRAEEMKWKANEAKRKVEQETERQQQEAVKTREQAEAAKRWAEQQRLDAEKAKLKAVEEAKKQQEEAAKVREQTEAAKRWAEQQRLDAEKAKLKAVEEAKKQQEEAAKVREQTEAAKRWAEQQRLDAEKAKLKAVEEAKKQQEEAAKVREQTEAAKRLAEQRRLDTEKEFERAQKQAENLMNQAAFRRLTNTAIEVAKDKLRVHIAELEETYRPIYTDSNFKHWKLYIDEAPVKDFAKEKQLSMVADWSPFETHYNNEKTRIKDKWDAQIENAKWKSPVKAMGTLQCKGGHTLTDEVVCYKDECKRKLFWIDGPHYTTICQGCQDVRTITDSLVCGSCKAEAHCTVRPSDYIP